MAQSMCSVPHNCIIVGWSSHVGNDLHGEVTKHAVSNSMDSLRHLTKLIFTVGVAFKSHKQPRPLQPKCGMLTVTDKLWPRVFHFHFPV